MNGKMKAAVVVALALVVVASTIYVAPTLAYMNGDIAQTRDRDMDRTRGQDCSCNCTCDQNQTRTHLQLEECIQNRTSMEYNWQHQWRNQNKYQS